MSAACEQATGGASPTPLIIVTDVHGCWYTLVRLLNQCAARHPGAKLVLLGDLIDRGPHSRQVVEFAMRHQIPTVKGNHEDLCLAYSAHTRRGFRAHCSGYYDRDVWLFNGGEDALSTWPAGLPDDVLTWMQELPAYLLPDVPPDAAGRKLLLSHTGYGLEADKGAWLTALWGRHGLDAPDFPDDGYYRVFGHTQQQEPAITETYAMIDTGAAYVKRGMGTLTALVWPAMEVAQQRFDESPVELRAEVSEGRIAA